MAHFRGVLRGNRSETSRLGSAASGMHASINGWEGGVDIEANVDMNGNDEVLVFMTSGSSHRGLRRHIATITVVEGEPIITYPALV